MPRRFDKRGWNRQFKWRPVRRDRWDPFPKDHLPFVDDYSMINVAAKVNAGQDMDTDENNTPGSSGTKRPRPEPDSGMKLPDYKKAKTSVKRGLKRAGKELFKEGKRAAFEYAMWKIIEYALIPETGGASVAVGEGIEMAELARREARFARQATEAAALTRRTNRNLNYGSHLVAH